MAGTPASFFRGREGGFLGIHVGQETSYSVLDFATFCDDIDIAVGNPAERLLKRCILSETNADQRKGVS
jgi:hypothetical protein